MAVTQRQRTVVNPARRRKLSAKQIKAGFGGKRRQAAVKRHRPAAKHPKSQTNKARPAHRRRAARPKTRTNLGKIISFSLPKEHSVAKTSRKNKSHRVSHRRRAAKKNPSHRRRTHRNPSMGDITGLVSTAVFTVAGAVGTQQLTQVVLQTNNTGIMGYFGNLVAAFLLSWGVKAFMKNDKAASAVLAGGFVEIVLRLIADYTPFGSFTSSLGVGDYLAQNFLTPQRIAYKPHQASLMGATPGTGMGACSSLYTGSGLYA